MTVIRADLVAGPREIVAELPRDVRFDLLLAAAGPGEIDRACRRLRALDPLRVIVRHLGGQHGRMARPVQRIVKPAGRRHAHGRTVAVAAVGRAVAGAEPAAEANAVSGVGIASAPFAHGLDQRRLHLVVGQARRIQQSLGHGDRHDGIVRKLGIPAKKREILALVSSVKFIGGADHVPQNRTDHIQHAPNNGRSLSNRASLIS